MDTHTASTTETENGGASKSYPGISLPMDIWNEIILWLPVSSLPRFSLACKALRDRIYNNEHWRKRIDGTPGLLQVFETHRAKMFFSQNCTQPCDWYEYYKQYCIVERQPPRVPGELVNDSECTEEKVPVLGPKKKLWNEDQAYLIGKHKEGNSSLSCYRGAERWLCFMYTGAPNESIDAEWWHKLTFRAYKAEFWTRKLHYPLPRSALDWSWFLLDCVNFRMWRVQRRKLRKSAYEAYWDKVDVCTDLDRYDYPSTMTP